MMYHKQTNRYEEGAPVRLQSVDIQLDDQFWARAWHYPGGYVVEYYQTQQGRGKSDEVQHHLLEVRPYNLDEIELTIWYPVTARLEEIRATSGIN